MMDELHGILSTYKIKIEKDKQEKPSTEKLAFKESNKTKTEE